MSFEFSLSSLCFRFHATSRSAISVLCAPVRVWLGLYISLLLRSCCLVLSDQMPTFGVEFDIVPLVSPFADMAISLFAASLRVCLRIIHCLSGTNNLPTRYAFNATAWLKWTAGAFNAYSSDMAVAQPKPFALEFRRSESVTDTCIYRPPCIAHGLRYCYYKSRKKFSW